MSSETLTDIGQEIFSWLKSTAKQADEEAE
jgi:hypothetical protein